MVLAAGVNWLTPAVSALSVLLGLLAGSSLRLREWRSQKRLDVYDEYLRACDGWRAACGRYRSARLAHLAKPDDPGLQAEERVAALEADAARIVHIQATHRVRLVGSRRVRAELQRNAMAVIRMAEIAGGAHPVTPSELAAAEQEYAAALESFIYAGSRDLLGRRAAKRKGGNLP